MRRRRPARGGGYTLIEVMAVVVVISVVMGLALVRADSFTPRFEVNKVAGDLAMYLRDARNRAIISNKVIRAELYPDRHEIHYFLEDPAADDDSAVEEEVPFEIRRWSHRVSLEKAIIGSDEAMDRQTVVLRFWPTGLCTPVRLYVQHQRKVNPMTVRMNPLTGLTKVVPGFEEPQEYEVRVKAPARRGGR